MVVLLTVGFFSFSFVLPLGRGRLGRAVLEPVGGCLCAASPWPGVGPPWVAPPPWPFLLGLRPPVGASPVVGPPLPGVGLCVPAPGAPGVGVHAQVFRPDQFVLKESRGWRHSAQGLTPRVNSKLS